MKVVHCGENRRAGGCWKNVLRGSSVQTVYSPLRENIFYKTKCDAGHNGCFFVRSVFSRFTFLLMFSNKCNMCTQLLVIEY